MTLTAPYRLTPNEESWARAAMRRAPEAPKGEQHPGSGGPGFPLPGPNKEHSPALVAKTGTRGRDEGIIP